MDATQFKQKAAQCRRLADMIAVPNDPARAALFKLAEEYETAAKTAEPASKAQAFCKE